MSQHCEFQWWGQELKFMYVQITQYDDTTCSLEMKHSCEVKHTVTK